MGFSVLFLLIIVIFKEVNEKSVIDAVLNVAGYTYGPLLGLFAFGILTKRKLNQKLIWAVCIIAPLIALGVDILSSPEWYEKKLHVLFGLNALSGKIFHGYKIGYELILINGIFTFTGLWFISSKNKNAEVEFVPAKA